MIIFNLYCWSNQQNTCCSVRGERTAWVGWPLWLRWASVGGSVHGPFKRLKKDTEERKKNKKCRGEVARVSATSHFLNAQTPTASGVVALSQVWMLRDTNKTTLNLPTYYDLISPSRFSQHSHLSYLFSSFYFLFVRFLSVQLRGACTISFYFFLHFWNFLHILLINRICFLLFTFKTFFMSY